MNLVYSILVYSRDEAYRVPVGTDDDYYHCLKIEEAVDILQSHVYVVGHHVIDNIDDDFLDAVFLSEDDAVKYALSCAFQNLVDGGRQTDTYFVNKCYVGLAT